MLTVLTPDQRAIIEKIASQRDAGAEYSGAPADVCAEVQFWSRANSIIKQAQASCNKQAQAHRWSNPLHTQD